jgi:adenine-specific DNA methylase
MDKKDSTIRKQLASKGELVAAIRFPNNIFKEAGTEVISDLLIFRKRERELGPNDELPDWVNVTEKNDVAFTARGATIDRKYTVNNYFLTSFNNVAFIAGPEV